MKSFCLSLVVLFAVFVFSGDCLAQCSGGTCRPARAVAARTIKVVRNVRPVRRVLRIRPVRRLFGRR